MTAAADDGSGLVLGARMAGTAEDRVLPAPDQRAAPGRDPRGRHQGRGQGPGTGRHRHRLRRRAAPGQRRGLLPGPDPRRAHPAAGQDRLLRLLRRGGHSAAAREARRARTATLDLATDFRFTRQLTRARSSSPSPARSRCPGGSATAPTPARRPGPRAGPPAQRRGPRAGRGRRRLPADRRAVPGGVPGARRAGRRGGQHRHRRHRRHLGAARVLRQQVRAAVLGRALRFPVPRAQGRPGGPGCPRVRA